MTTLEIRNIGPIKHAAFDLNKINVFIGPQSSGKSTIAKIFSFCSWLEKNYFLCIHDMREQYIKASDVLLRTYHNMTKQYFSEDSYILYESDTCTLSFGYPEGSDRFSHTFTRKDACDSASSCPPFENRQICYIPAERNFLAAVKTERYTDTPNSITEFIAKWYTAKEEYTDHRLEMPAVHAQYYYDEDARQDRINVDGVDIQLVSGSSGLQSIVPLLVLVDYYAAGIYGKTRSLSPQLRRAFKEGVTKFAPVDKEQELLAFIDDLNHIPTTDEEYLHEFWKRLSQILGIDVAYHFTRFIIEEPEQNLFPKTQKQLVVELLDKVKSATQPHDMIITTHSPYVLFAINNCMLGGLVQNKLDEADKAKLHNQITYIDPKNVSVYSVDNGTITSMQGEDGLIDENFLGQAMQEIMDEFDIMLDYYDTDEDE